MVRRKINILLACIILFSLIFFFSYNSSYGYLEGKEQSALHQKIDTKNLNGINKQIVEIYNDDRLLYAIIVTLVMAILGTTLAFVTDFILKILGMDVSKISHHE